MDNPPTKTQDFRLLVLKDIIISNPKDYIFVISNSLHILHESQVISNRLISPIGIFDQTITNIPVEQLKNDTTSYPLYIVIYDSYKSSTPLEIVIGIRKNDMFGHILFILNYEGENIKAINDIKEAPYYAISMAIRTKGDTIIFNIFEKCAYCNNGQDSMLQVNRWKLNGGFENNLEFKRSFKGNFQGATVRVTLVPDACCIFMDGDNYYGLEWYLLLYSIIYLNFTLEILHPGDRYWGSFVDGNWNGMVGMVVRNEADLAIGGITITANRFTAVNPTSVIVYEDIVMVSTKPKKSARWQSLFVCFTWDVWVFTFGTIFATGIFIYIVDRYNQEPLNISVITAISIPLKVMCIEPIHWKQPSLSVAMILSTWMFVAMIWIAIYTGAMQSILLTPVHGEEPINTLDDLEQTDKKMLIREGFFWGEYMETYYPVADRIQYFKTNIGKQMVLNNSESYVVLADSKSMNSEAIKGLGIYGRNPFHFGSQKLIINVNSWMVRKDCIYNEAFSNVQMLFEQYGLKKHYTGVMVDFFKDPVLMKYGYTYKEVEITYITMEFFFAISQVFVIGYLLAIFIFGTEYVKFWFNGGNSKKVDTEPESMYDNY